MKKNMIIFGAVIAIVAILSVGMVMAVFDMDKTATKLEIKEKSPVYEGDNIQIKLTDANGTVISNQTVNITITDGDNDSSNYSLVTSKKGVAKLELDKSAGEYKIECKFNGNDQYNGTSSSKNITIEGYEEESEDSGAYYSEQAGDVISTGEIHEGPDGNFYRHEGGNEWVQV